MSSQPASTISNPFQKADQRKLFDDMVKLHDRKHPMLFMPDGSQCMNTTVAAAFWLGHANGPYAWPTHLESGSVDAAWKAGRAVALRDGSTDVM